MNPVNRAPSDSENFANLEPPTAALFAPIKVGEHELRNRFVMAPMSRRSSPDGTPNQDSVEYYRLRASGGVALVITEPAYVRGPAAGPHTEVPRMYGPERASAWKQVVDAVHDEGARIFPQIWHTGASRGANPEFEPHLPTLSPSGVGVDGQEVGTVLDEATMDQIATAFGDSAHYAQELGFDGVELNGAHGFLLDQFLWSRTNRRTDRFGGDPAARAQFPADVVRRIRSAVRPDFIVSFRFSQWKIGDYTAQIARSSDELAHLLMPLVDAGVDVFHASTRRHWEPAFPTEGPLGLAGWTRRITKRPTITVGSVGVSSSAGEGVVTAGLPDLVEQFARAEFDLVSLGRALLADPSWVEKTQANRSHEIQRFESGNA
jgi:2,4-dienoyl-CoA reductase-like NADH-dependent reductase (Old Yellow Enzyme family)